MISKNFGKKLKELREKDNDSQIDLAKMLSLTSRQIQRYEDGHIPRMDKLKILCSVYKFDFIKLIQDDLQFSADHLEMQEDLAPYGGDQMAYIKSLKETIAAQNKTISYLEEKLQHIAEGQQKPRA